MMFWLDWFGAKAFALGVFRFFVVGAGVFALYGAEHLCDRALGLPDKVEQVKEGRR